MADPWELICHHTYSGTPGVVYDQSPPHSSHGEALGLGATEFLADGAAPGSGGIRIRQDGQRIRVPQSRSWSPLVGLRAEMTVRIDSQTAGLGLRAGGNWRWLMSSQSCFQFAVINQHLLASFAHGPGPTIYDRVHTSVNGLAPNIRVPYDRWVTLGFMHDGHTAIELYIDGVTVARVAPQRPVLPAMGGVFIGNGWGPDYPVVGTVDEVKLWRLDPYRISNDFFDRRMDDAARRCWEEFLSWLRRWREANPDCAAELDGLIAAWVRDIAARIARATPDDRLSGVKQRYRELWQENRMGGSDMADLLSGFAAELAENGVDPQRDDGLRQILESDCYSRLVAEMPSLDCDPEIAAYLGIRSSSGSGCCGA
jgi:hypothetical protein